MSPSQDKTLPRPNRRIAEEDRAWCRLYRSARDPAVAAEVVQHLRNDPEAARCHLALYLCCRQTLRAHKARIARQQRIRRVLRRYFAALVSTPAAIVRKLLARQEDRPIELAPQYSAPHAVRRLLVLPGSFEPARGVPSSVEPSHVRTAMTASSADPAKAGAAMVA
jgi:hypothetical protein